MRTEVEVTSAGVKIRRGLLLRSLLQDVDIPADSLLGWRVQAPDALAPGWIHFLIADATTNGYVRSYAQSRMNPAVVRFSPGQAAECAALDQRLMNLQAGYPLERGLTGEASVDEAGAGADAAVASGSVKSAAAGSGPEGTGSKDTGSKTAGAQSRGGGKRAASWSKVATPDEVPEPNPDADIANPVYGQTVVVTGAVDPYDKGEIWDMIAEAGGQAAKNVTKKTTVLILGQWEGMTSKEKRARELADKGQEIQLWPLDEFLDKVGRK